MRLNKLDNLSPEPSEEVVADSAPGTTDTETKEALPLDQAIDSEEELPAEMFYDIDGEEISLETIKSWKSGSMMQADYTRGKQEVSERSKSLKIKEEAIGQKIQALDDIESEIENLISGDELSSEEMEVLLDSDPSEYIRRQEAKRNKAGKLDEIRQRKEVLRNEFLSNGYERLHSKLGWDNEEKKASDLKAINSAISESGMTKTRADLIADPEIYEAFIDAKKYRDLLKSRPELSKRAKAAPTSISPSKKSQQKKVLSLSERMYGAESK
jgi:hypothetical protein